MLQLYSKPSNQVSSITMNHIFLFQSPCSSMPCQNGGTCMRNYKNNIFECHCFKGFSGEYCEKGRPANVENFLNLELFSLSCFIVILRTYDSYES